MTTSAFAFDVTGCGRVGLSDATVIRPRRSSASYASWLTPSKERVADHEKRRRLNSQSRWMWTVCATPLTIYLRPFRVSARQTELDSPTEQFRPARTSGPVFLT